MLLWRIHATHLLAAACTPSSRPWDCLSSLPRAHRTSNFAAPGGARSSAPWTWQRAAAGHVWGCDVCLRCVSAMFVCDACLRRVSAMYVCGVGSRSVSQYSDRCVHVARTSDSDFRTSPSIEVAVSEMSRWKRLVHVLAPCTERQPPSARGKVCGPQRRGGCGAGFV